MKDLRTAYIQVRVTQEEYETIKKLAEKAGLSMSPYLRSLALKEK